MIDPLQLMLLIVATYALLVALSTRRTVTRPKNHAVTRAELLARNARKRDGWTR